ncbi:MULTISPECIES: AlkA N-terminal domain-containing protein [unclassified Breznakia]|uniref:DNA-3-methyladenine glycosylase 2 family protein n=1 Tax=unclassified Breznakia TaxID=2623764 RepID=UPI0024753C15|nr:MULTISPECIES: AlkA N-terminal domain-containing protein [unclassified Breznakia]MDH6366600.1 AraC family transcriptional regulator of adaptative response / DNA-3-methyladenine glycosylase II [Breznakia sp. PH1-1]MDH6403693.1 AraC family transcriptional regulator of adaptative response / DNA-3-methyladenine glycosylase II [Breznakia sp. PF1-11]MDH6411402.1 AraC family transcriptional regulator of adaptative response / DNA-3-methyladenine glycosylase II [Breznakia sp. PFB1-11]MDH6413867.1 AraC
MKENLDYLYQAFQAKDIRFDGKYFMSVASTGIYCRPVCSAKMPKKQNCTFCKSAAEAELHGYRPCLICRPELAPGSAKIDHTKQILKQALQLIDDGYVEEHSMSELAQTLKVSDRHLRRIFQEELHISPKNYIDTARLLLAKNLLTDTSLRIVDVAYAAGFKSLRRFNDTFKVQYRMSPSHFRKGCQKVKDDTITVKLGYKKPFRYDALLAFLANRLIPGVEKIENDTYYRVLTIKQNDTYIYGTIIVENAEKQSVLKLTISESLIQVLPQVIRKVRHMFDLHSDPYLIYELLESANTIIPDCYKIGTRIPGSPNDFEMVCRAIIGQLVSVKQAIQVLGRFSEQFGEPVNSHIEGLQYAFPTPEKVASMDRAYDVLCPLGLTRTKVDALKGVANLLCTTNLQLQGMTDYKKTKQMVCAIRGIGAWTFDYVALRTFIDTDILLTSDYVIKKRFQQYAIEDQKVFDAYKPYRSYITIGLWELENK